MKVDLSTYFDWSTLVDLSVLVKHSEDQIGGHSDDERLDVE